MLKLRSRLIKISIKVLGYRRKKERKTFSTKTEHEAGNVLVVFGNTGKRLYL